MIICDETGCHEVACQHQRIREEIKELFIDRFSFKIIVTYCPECGEIYRIEKL